jgi:hypothetical protein
MSVDEELPMQIPVLIESMPGNGYRARGGEPFAITTEGATPEDALNHFQESVSAKLREGAVLTTVEIQPAEHPLLKFAGMYDPNDPLIQEWLQIIKEERDREIV